MWPAWQSRQKIGSRSIAFRYVTETSPYLLQNRIAPLNPYGMLV